MRGRERGRREREKREGEKRREGERRECEKREGGSEGQENKKRERVTPHKRNQRG